MKNKKITWEDLQEEQDKIVSRLNKKLTKAEGKALARAIEIEYILAMVEEGHNIDEI